jgi:N-sulfoglucosamine sulfohydrolase
MYGVRTVEAYTHRPEFELYDLENDPYESRNLAQEAAYTGELATLKEKIRAFQERSNDPWILKWEYE